MRIKTFLNYAVPSIVAMWVFSLYTMVDGLFVANFVGPTAMASVNIAMPTINLIFALSLLFSTGTSTIIAVNFGKGKYKEANEIFTTNTLVLILISILITVFGLINIESIARFLGATINTEKMVIEYLGIILLFAVFFIVSYQFEVLVKTDGFPRLATWGVISSAITNVVLDYIFIVHFGWGVKGAALATGLSQVVSTVLFAIYFISKKSRLSFVNVDLSLIKEGLYKKIIALGISDSLTELSAGITVFVFNQTILRVIGEQGIVTYTIISYANLLVLMTMIGIAQGMQPLVSFYLGKEDMVTCKYFLRLAAIMTTICTAIIMYLSIFETDFIVEAFIGSQDEHLYKYSIKAFRMFSLSFMVVGFNILISGYFVAVEDAFRAIAISLSRGLFVLVFSLVGMVFVFGETGIWISTFVSECIVLVMSIIFYKGYRKKIYLDEINVRQVKEIEEIY